MSDATTVADAVEDFGPVKMTLGKTKVFPGDEYDVVYVEVLGGDVARLNRLLRDNLPHEPSDHPTFVPHVTIAYVAPGKGKEYAGLDDVEGKVVTCTDLVFSTPDGDKTTIPLAGGTVHYAGPTQPRQTSGSAGGALHEHAAATPHAAPASSAPPTAPKPPQSPGGRRPTQLAPTDPHAISHEHLEGLMQRAGAAHRTWPAFKLAMDGGYIPFFDHAHPGQRALGRELQRLGHAVRMPETAPPAPPQDEPPYLAKVDEEATAAQEADRAAQQRAMQESSAIDRLRTHAGLAPEPQVQPIKQRAPGEPFGPSKAKVEVEGHPVDFELRMNKIFGSRRKVDAEHLSSIVGAPDDAKVSAREGTSSTGHYAIGVNVDHPAFRASRQIFKNRGGIHVYNESFFPKPGVATGRGLGADVFGRQVEQCREAGIASIQCHAAKANPRNPEKPHNGYITWPKFGYDADIKRENFDTPVYHAIRQNFPEAETLQDVMATPEGRKWWEENGSDVYHMTFDLTPGSPSMRIWEAYQEKKRLQKGAKNE